MFKDSNSSLIHSTYTLNPTFIICDITIPWQQSSLFSFAKNNSFGTLLFKILHVLPWFLIIPYTYCDVNIVLIPKYLKIYANIC